MALCLPLLVCAPACRRDAEGSACAGTEAVRPGDAGRGEGGVSVKRATGDEWPAGDERHRLYETTSSAPSGAARPSCTFPPGRWWRVPRGTLLGIAETRAAPGRPQADVTVLRGAVDATLDRPANQSLTVGTPAATVRAGRKIDFQ